MSREHAVFTRRSDGIYVNDLGSVNGVLVNNTKVSEFRLYDGDLITVWSGRAAPFNPSEPLPRESERPANTSPLSRITPSRSAPSPTPFGAAHDAHAHAHVEPPARVYEPPPVHSDASATFRSELHPAIAGHLAAEGLGHRRRPSVRVRIQESWETSSGIRYAIVIVAASILAVCAVIVGFSLAG